MYINVSKLAYFNKYLLIYQWEFNLVIRAQFVSHKNKDLLSQMLQVLLF